jgi:hypothetical protein
MYAIATGLLDKYNSARFILFGAGPWRSMFGELISFVNVLRTAAQDYRAKNSGAGRQAIISRMLETYFYLKDAVDEGEDLVHDAAPNPVEFIASLDSAEAALKLREWDFVLRRQTFRLYRVSENVFGQNFIEVLSPGLRDRLDDVIGSKFNRATSLHGIGAQLFFRSMVSSSHSDEDKARYITVMAGEEGDFLHMEKIREEIAALRVAMEAYSQAIKELASTDEILRLSQQAKTNTRLPPSSDGD